MINFRFVLLRLSVIWISIRTRSSDNKHGGADKEFYTLYATFLKKKKKTTILRHSTVDTSLSVNNIWDKFVELVTVYAMKYFTPKGRFNRFVTFSRKISKYNNSVKAIYCSYVHRSTKRYGVNKSPIRLHKIDGISISPWCNFTIM
jgi:hypothetical protein